MSVIFWKWDMHSALKTNQTPTSRTSEERRNNPFSPQYWLNHYVSPYLWYYFVCGINSRGWLAGVSVFTQKQRKPVSPRHSHLLVAEHSSQGCRWGEGGQLEPKNFTPEWFMCVFNFQYSHLSSLTLDFNMPDGHIRRLKPVESIAMVIDLSCRSKIGYVSVTIYTKYWFNTHQSFDFFG